MSLIKIFANDIELDVVKETLTITKENNAFTKDFKVSYSDFPFLIVENIKTIKALGGRDITSVNKPKIVPVVVEELNERYSGELQILSYLKGFRKVNLKYASELLTIMDKSISSFMPIVSVIPGEENPIPFSEESNAIIPGEWTGYVNDFANKSYPDVKYNFPMMYWKNKFGVDLGDDNEWINYKQHINFFDENGDYALNSYTDGVVDNNNVAAPQIYLLSPLFYALQSLGWKMEGDFTNSEFIKRLIFLSTKNNLCKISISAATEVLNYSATPIWTSFIDGFFANTYINFRTRLEFTVPSDGKYTLNWMYEIDDDSNDPSGRIKTYVLAFRSYQTLFGATKEVNKTRLFNNNTNGIKKFSGNNEFNCKAGDKIIISYCNLHQKLPIDYTISVVKVEETKTLHQFHPTIELGRYLPDWSFGTYLNEMKKLFNLKIDIDDFRKRVNINFNEDIIEKSEKEILKKSLEIKVQDQPPFTYFHLKFQNDIDSSLWISRSSVELFTEQKSEFVDILESKFKLVPNNGYTAELSESLEDKDGVGLMIYNQVFFPYISNNFSNQTLTLEGQNGIYQRFWKNWLKFRLNATPVEMTGYFTETELSKIQKKLRTNIDRQDYLVSSIGYSETDQSNFEVLLKIESVNF